MLPDGTGTFSEMINCKILIFQWQVQKFSNNLVSKKTKKKNEMEKKNRKYLKVWNVSKFFEQQKYRENTESNVLRVIRFWKGFDLTDPVALETSVLTSDGNKEAML